MNVGFASIDISPISNLPYQVYDPLQAIVLALTHTDGTPAGLIITLDLTETSNKPAKKLQAAIAEQTGTIREQVILHMTHNHSAPRTRDINLDMFADLLVQASQQAIAEAVPASISYGSGELTGLSVNRRWDSKTDLGSITVINNDNCRYENDTIYCRDYIIKELEELGVNNIPDIPEDASLEPADDNGLLLIRFQNDDGELIGGIVRWAAHVDQLCLRDGRFYSAEYPGYLRAKMEAELGGKFMFLNGPCGDTKAIYTAYTREECERIGTAIADAALGLQADSTAFEPLQQVSFQSEHFEIQARADVSHDAFELSQEMYNLRSERIDRISTGSPYAEIRPWDNHRWVVDTMAYRAHASRESAEEIAGDTWPFTISLIDFAPGLRLLCMQDEIFGQMTPAVLKQFPDKGLSLISLCGSGNWYLVPEDEIAKMGYEPTCSMYAPGTFETVLEKTITFVGQYT